MSWCRERERERERGGRGGGGGREREMANIQREGGMEERDGGKEGRREGGRDIRNTHGTHMTRKLPRFKHIHPYVLSIIRKGIDFHNSMLFLITPINLVSADRPRCSGE
jgi:hypothetical protein